jgi:hypothetical protein
LLAAAAAADVSLQVIIILGIDLMSGLHTEKSRSVLPKIDAALLHSSVLLMCHAGEWLSEGLCLPACVQKEMFWDCAVAWIGMQCRPCPSGTSTSTHGTFVLLPHTH